MDGVKVSGLEGITEKTNNNGWYAIRLHWFADPEKRIHSPLSFELLEKIKADDSSGRADLAKRIALDPQSTVGDKWFAEMQKNFTSQDWRQEMEIDWSVFRGEPVFPSFRFNTHTGILEPDINYDFPILVGLDFGGHRPAMIISQWTGRTWNWLEEWLPTEIKTQDFGIGVGRRVGKYKKKGFIVRYFSGASDPTAQNRQTLESDVKVFSDLGITVEVIQNTKIPRRIHIVRLLLDVWEDGVPGLMLDRELCPVSIKAFEGAFRFPEQRPQKPADERPLKDGIYDNPMDAGQYIAEQMFDTRGEYHYSEEEERLIESKLAFPNPYARKRLIHPYFKRGGRKPLNKRMGY